MFKKILNLIKNNKEEKHGELVRKKLDNEDLIKSKNNKLEEVEIKSHEVLEIEESIEENLLEFTEEDRKYIKSIKIQRGKGIKSIDIYSNEEITFETYIDCSKQICVPIEYIKENLEYGYTDYFGDAIKYLSRKLRVDISNLKADGKTIFEIFNFLQNKLWDESISEQKRDDILSSEKIEPVKMHYKFEIIDNEYDEYYKKYCKLIRRGGKKRVELINKKNEVIEVFKSLDDCANFFKKDKNEIIERLKKGECKIGRYEIRYSLRR